MPRKDAVGCLTHQLQRTRAHRNRHQVNDYLDLVQLAESVCLGAPAAVRRRRLNYCRSLLQAQTRCEKLKHCCGSTSLIRDSARSSRSTLAQPTVARSAGRWKVFAALGDRLIEQCDAQIVLIGAPAERANAAQVLAQMRLREAVNLAGETTMAQLVGLLARCDLLVSNDTGPAHIAAALGRPTLTIFGPTNEWETAPTGARAALIRAEGIECARCMHRDCPIDHRCMTRLSVEAVVERALSLLRA
jgi:hypothetical protein